LTTAGIVILGLINAIFVPNHRLTLLAGCVRVINGDVTITPERRETVSADG
jgi:hypothetical protein